MCTRQGRTGAQLVVDLPCYGGQTLLVYALSYGQDDFLTVVILTSITTGTFWTGYQGNAQEFRGERRI